MIEAVRHVIMNGHVAREGREAGTWKVLDQRPTGEVLRHLPTSMSTGLMPPGIRLFREAGGCAQIVQELPPAIGPLIWGPTEGAVRGIPPQHTYLCAMPWLVVLSKWQDKVLVGARMFYRPQQLMTLDDELFHTNLPNINCFGYNGTSVGWVCLYGDRVPTQTLDWAGRMMRMFERASGGEAYSEANMRTIDGPACYRRYRSGETWTYLPKEWEKRSKRYKTPAAVAAWPLKLWHDQLVPVKVKGLDDQLAHAERGTPLTVRMALDGQTNWYYTDHAPLAPPAAEARGKNGVGNDTLATQQFNSAYAKACQKKGR